MIKKYKQYIKESLLDKLKGPTKEEVWKNLGFDKSFETPEDFFLYVINDIKIKEQTKYPNHVYWEKNDEILFEQDLKTMVLYVNFRKIWTIFKSIFHMSFVDIQILIKDVVEEHLKWTGFTPLASRIH